MLQKLIEPFKSKRPKVEGDIRITIQQNPLYQPTSHLNALQIHSHLPVQFKWFRVNNKQKEELISNTTNTYQFQLADILHTIKVVVISGNLKSLVTVGPIHIDESTQISLLNILNNNGTKFPITISYIRIHQNDRIIAETKQINFIATLGINEDRIRLSIDGQSLSCLIKHSINNVKVVSGDKMQLKFNHFDGVSYEEMRKFISQMISYRLQNDEKVDIHFSVSCAKQQDLIQLSLQLFGAKQIIINHKFVQQIDKICQCEFDGITFQSSGYLMCVIQNQQCYISQLINEIQQLEKEKNLLINKLNQMEGELELTIENYQQIMAEHNIGTRLQDTFNNNSLSNYSSSLNKSLGKSQIIYKKQIEQYQQEIKELKDKNNQLKQVQDFQVNQAYYGFSRDQLIKLLCEMELNWQKAKRLNEILNRELNNSTNQENQQNEQQIKELQERIVELSFQNQLIDEYRLKIIDQQKQIDILNKQLIDINNSNNNSQYIEQLESEIESLKNQTEQNYTSFTMDQDLVTENEKVIQENNELIQQNRNLKKKLQSLQSEIDNLLRNPIELQRTQNQFLDIKAQRQNSVLRSKLKELETECSQLKEELDKSKLQKSILTTSYQKTEVSRISNSPPRRSGSRSLHGGIFDELPPQPSIKRLGLNVQKGKQHNYSVIQ